MSIDKRSERKEGGAIEGKVKKGTYIPRSDAACESANGQTSEYSRISFMIVTSRSLFLMEPTWIYQ